MEFQWSPGPSTIKHPTEDYTTADYPKNILSATKKQRTNQLPFATKFDESSPNFGRIPQKKFYSSDIVNLADDPPDLADDLKKKFYSTGPRARCYIYLCFPVQ